MHFSALLGSDVPFFNSQFLVIENHAVGVGAELGCMRVKGVDAEEICQRLARHDEDAALILSKQIFPVTAELDLLDVITQTGLKADLSDKTRQLLFHCCPL